MLFFQASMETELTQLESMFTFCRLLKGIETVNARIQIRETHRLQYDHYLNKCALCQYMHPRLATRLNVT
jgi:hypothetical protein